MSVVRTVAHDRFVAGLLDCPEDRIDIGLGIGLPLDDRTTRIESDAGMAHPWDVLDGFGNMAHAITACHAVNRHVSRFSSECLSCCSHQIL